MSAAPLALLDRIPPAPAGAREPDARRAPADDLGGRRVLRCRACGLVVTRPRDRVEIAGAHEHDRMNPAGIVFRIGCFRAAPGCVGVGERSADFAWFPGFTWRIALCRGCFQHLGWVFEGAPNAFHGLVLERLVPDEEQHAGEG